MSEKTSDKLAESVEWVPLNELKEKIIQEIRDNNKVVGSFSENLKNLLLELATSYPEDYKQLYFDLYKNLYPNDDLAEAVFELLGDHETKSKIYQIYTLRYGVAPDEIKRFNPQQQKEFTSTSGIFVKNDMSLKLHIALVVAASIRLENITDIDYNKIIEQMKKDKTKKFQHFFMRPNEIKNALLNSLSTYKGKLPEKKVPEIPKELKGFQMKPSQQDTVMKQKYEDKIAPKKKVIHNPEDYKKIKNTTISPEQVKKQKEIAMEKAKKEKELQKELNDYQTKRKLKDITTDQTTKNKEQPSSDLAPLRQDNNPNVGMDDKSPEVEGRDGSIVAYYQIDAPEYHKSPLYLLTNPVGNARNWTPDVPSTEHLIPVGRLQTAITPWSLLPCFLNADGVKAIPDPESFLDKDGNHLDVTMEYSPSAGSFRVAKGDWMVSYTLMAGSSETRKPYNALPSNNITRSDPIT